MSALIRIDSREIFVATEPATMIDAFTYANSDGRYARHVVIRESEYQHAAHRRQLSETLAEKLIDGHTGWAIDHHIAAVTDDGDLVVAVVESMHAAVLLASDQDLATVPVSTIFDMLDRIQVPDKVTLLEQAHHRLAALTK